jgi:CBS domain-containing protein
MTNLRFNLSFPPFELLSADEQEALAEKADVLFFGNDMKILMPGQKVDAFYLVVKGIVGEMDDGEVVGVYREKDAFDSRAVITGHVTNGYVAHEETLLYALPRRIVMELAESNAAFGMHFFAGISEKSGMGDRGGHREWQNLFSATIREIGIRSPVFLDASATVADAARVMREKRCRTVFVRDGARTGIFTTSNFLDIVIDQVPSDSRISTRARYELFCCERDEYVFSALLLMTRKNINRVIVTECGEPVGELSQIDLLSFFSSHSHLVSRQIESAATFEDLVEAARNIDPLIETLNSGGMKTPQLARLVQALDLRVMARLWALLAPPRMIEESTLLVLGSGGRGEQILKTDQDNALIFSDRLDRDEVAAVADRFCAALRQLGYPPCSGGIMLNNSDWRGTIQDWKARIHHWIYQPQKDTWMYLAAWLDATVAAGNETALAQCQAQLSQYARNETQWLGWLANAIMQFDQGQAENPFWKHLLNRRAQARFDIKKGGIFPLVHGLRVLALEHGVKASNSFERLEALQAVEVIDRELGESLGEALAFLMKLRLSGGIEARRWGDVADNIVDTGKLSFLERDSLKDSLAIVRRFKAFISRRYQLGRF